MKKASLLIVVVLLLALPLASAVLTDADAYYSCDNSTITGGKSGTMDDLSSTNVDLTLFNTYSAAGSGIVNEACRFNDHTATTASTSYARRGLTTYLNGENVFTVTFWGYYRIQPDYSTFIGTYGTGGKGFSTYPQTPGSTNTLFYTYDSNGAFDDPAKPAIGLSTWAWYRLTFNDGLTCISKNNDAAVCQSDDLAANLESIQELTIGARADNLQRSLDGRVDEIGIWLRNLTDAEATTLYNAGAGFNPYASPPGPSVTATAVTPTDNELDDDRNRTFNFNVSTSGTGASVFVNASLWLNVSDSWFTHSNFTNVEISNGTDRNTTTEIWLNETVGGIQWKIEVTVNSTASSNTTARTLTIDSTAPPITAGAGNELTTDNLTIKNIHFAGGETLTINFNASDPELFRFDFNATLDNGTHLSQHTANDLNVTEYNFTVVLNLSTLQATNITASIFAADGHTARWIEAIPYETTSNSVTFDYPDGTVCTLEAEEANLAGLTVEYNGLDRMIWSITKNSAKKEHGFTLDCNKRIEDISHRFAFPNFVIGGAWFDFAINGPQPGEYVVTRLSETKFNVKLKYVEPTASLAFSSTGLLNTNFVSYSAEILVTPNNPVTLDAPNGSITWIATNWTAGLGASFYAVYRDSVNVVNTSALVYNHTGLSGGTSYDFNVHSVFNQSDTFYENLSALPTATKSTTFNGTLSVEIRNEANNKVLNGVEVFISLIGVTSNVTGNTSTGILGLINISSENYTVRHSAIGWGSRDQYLEIGENDSGSILLYLINDTIRDPGIVFVRDTQSDGVNGSIVKILRYFNDENAYRVVQMATTNDDGRSVFDAEAFDAYYKWVVEYQGSTLVQTTVPEFLSKDLATGLWTKAFTINIGTDFWESYIAQPAMSHAVTYTNATRTLTYSYNDPAGLIIKACIKADYANMTRWETVGPNCLNAATGGINLILPNENRTYHYTAYYETSTKYSEDTPIKGDVRVGNWFCLLYTSPSPRDRS